MGFCLERIDLTLGARTILPSWVGFADDPDSMPKAQPDGTSEWVRKTTDVWPVQKFVWRAFTARADGKYQYTVTEMIRDGAGNLVKGTWSESTNEVVLTPVVSDHVACYFNRGILSTQALTEDVPADERQKRQAGESFRLAQETPDNLGRSDASPPRRRVTDATLHAHDSH
jgi:hypothetical protein